MFGRTITIFSKHGETWYPRVFHDTQIIRDRGTIARTYGETANETTAVHIKRKDGKAEGLYDVYEPKAWAALADVTGAVSFKTGDIIWLGDWGMVDDRLTPIPDSEHPGGLYAYVRGIYDGVCNITNVAEFRELPHWEIAGR